MTLEDVQVWQKFGNLQKLCDPTRGRPWGCRQIERPIGFLSLGSGALLADFGDPQEADVCLFLVHFD